MNEPPPLRNQMQAASGGAACGRVTGLNHNASTSNCNNTLTGAKLADAAFQFSNSSTFSPRFSTFTGHRAKK
jgi:hypothetical protein